MENWRRAEHGQGRCGNRWKHHTWSRSGAPTVHRGPALGQGRRHSSKARTCPAVSGPADSFFSFAKVLVSVASTTSRECTATRSCRSNESLKFMTRLDSDPTRGAPGFQGMGQTQRRPVPNRVQESAGSTHSSQTAHPSNDPGRSLGWLSTEATLRDSSGRSY